MRERYILVEHSRLVTAAEMERWPEEDGKMELVEGRVIRMSPAGPSHGVVVMRLGVLLDAHVRPRGLGFVFPEVGFILRLNPDTVRAPDMAFLRGERMPAPDTRGFIKGPPDLAAEVLSPHDRPGEMRA
jgi:Uma2 family endonuclease